MIPLELIPQLVVQFQGLKRWQKSGFYAALAPYGCSKTILTQLRPYLGQKYQKEPVERLVRPDLLEAATKVAEAKKAVQKVTKRVPSTASVLSHLDLEFSPPVINAVIRSKRLWDRGERPTLRKLPADIDYADCSGSGIFCLKSGGADPIIQFMPAADSSEFKNHSARYARRQSLMMIGVLHGESRYATIRYHLGDPTSLDVSAVVRQHWSKNGRPEGFCSDNGGEMHGAVDLLLEEFGVPRVPSGVRNPRSKLVEGLWRQVLSGFEAVMVLRLKQGEGIPLSVLQQALDSWLLSKHAPRGASEILAYGAIRASRRRVRRIGEFGAFDHGGKLWSLAEHSLPWDQIRHGFIYTSSRGNPKYLLTSKGERVEVKGEYIVRSGREWLTWDPVKRGKGNEVLSCHMDSGKIAYHENSVRAGDELGISPSTIAHCLMGSMRQAKGYLFLRYIDGIDPAREFRDLQAVAHEDRSGAKPVISLHLATGKEREHQSARRAAGDLNMSDRYVRLVLKGEVSQAKGYSFRYKDY